jgi:hypothetical protein
MPEIDIDYVDGLIDGVVFAISEVTSIESHEEIVDAVEVGSEFDFEKGAQIKDKKRKKKLNFDIDDITGILDIDDEGSFIFDHMKMRDNLNRKINKHGYLSDSLGNIVN